MMNQGYQIWHPNCVRFALNGSASQNVLKLILKNPRFIPFGPMCPTFVANLRSLSSIGPGVQTLNTAYVTGRDYHISSTGSLGTTFRQINNEWNKCQTFCDNILAWQLITDIFICIVTAEF